MSRDTIKGLLASGDTESLATITSYAFRNATMAANGTSANYSSDKGRFNTYASNGTALYNNQAVGWIGAGAKVDLFAVVFDNTSLDKANNYMFIETSQEGVISTSYGNTDIGKTATFHFGSQADNSWYKIGTVPEPTSGILLALGVAALALKRKQAA